MFLLLLTVFLFLYLSLRTLAAYYDGTTFTCTFACSCSCFGSRSGTVHANASPSSPYPADSVPPPTMPSLPPAPSPNLSDNEASDRPPEVADYPTVRSDNSDTFDHPSSASERSPRVSDTHEPSGAALHHSSGRRLASDQSSDQSNGGSLTSERSVEHLGEIRLASEQFPALSN